MEEKKYERDEKAFCLEILEPLFRKMGISIHCPTTMGQENSGRILLFSEFGQVLIKLDSME